jgi:hypothetical protein
MATRFYKGDDETNAQIGELHSITRTVFSLIESRPKAAMDRITKDGRLARSLPNRQTVRTVPCARGRHRSPIRSAKQEETA